MKSFEEWGREDGLDQEWGERKGHCDVARGRAVLVEFENGPDDALKGAVGGARRRRRGAVSVHGLHCISAGCRGQGVFVPLVVVV